MNSGRDGEGIPTGGGEFVEGGFVGGEGPGLVPVPEAPEDQDACLQSYPDTPMVCIGSPDDVNCETLIQGGLSNFTVLPPDPLGLDNDGDGIGCEDPQITQAEAPP
jgi:hypothetical protein